MQKSLCILSVGFLVSVFLLNSVIASPAISENDPGDESTYSVLDGSIKTAIKVMDKAMKDAESDKEQIEIMIYIGKVLVEIDPKKEEQMKKKLEDIENKLISIRGWLANTENTVIKQGMGKREEQIHLLMIVKAYFIEVQALLKDVMSDFEKEFKKRAS